MAAAFLRRGKSGLPETTVPGNARAEQSDGKRRREETTQPARRCRRGWEKVKRWGKSPPGGWQQTPHGKPHREQCRIGGSRASAQGRFSPDPRVGSTRPLVTTVPDEWSSIRSRRTESGLQALRAYFPSVLWRKTGNRLDSRAPARRRRVYIGIHGASHDQGLDAGDDPWRSRPRLKSA